MNLTENQIRKLYLEVSDEYNRTPLAVNGGWFHRPSEFGLLEMKMLVKYLPNESAVFLDIGTGMGIAPRLINKLGVKVISIDSQSAASTTAIENVRLAGVEGHTCELGREQIPISSGTVDCVFFGDVIEHLIHSPKPAILEIFRVLKPNGFCISTTPNATRLTVRLRVLIGYSNWANIHEYYEREFHAGHHHEYTIDEFKFVFQSCGFDIEEFVLYESSLREVKIKSVSDIITQDRSRTRGTLEPFYVTFVKIVLLFVTKFFPQLRSNMLLVARKSI